MKAEVLRKAAALMRERAEAASTGSAWEWGNIESQKQHDFRSLGQTWAAVHDDQKILICIPGGKDVRQPRAEHVASWHPAVALAVADWLADAALVDPDDEWVSPEALAVATAYLGSDA